MRHSHKQRFYCWLIVEAVLDALTTGHKQKKYMFYKENDVKHEESVV